MTPTGHTLTVLPPEHGQRPRVLVIEDDPGICRYLRRALVGYLLDEAPGARAGMDRLRRQTPDLVLLDLGLPDLPGDQVLEAIRATHPRLPVIVWTAAQDPAVRQRCQSLGLHAFLPKPSTLDVLLATVAEALAGSGSGRQATLPERLLTQRGR